MSYIFNDLSPEEIANSVFLIRANYPSPGSLNFESCTLDYEPLKQFSMNSDHATAINGENIQRISKTICYDNEIGHTFIFYIDLISQKILQKIELDNVQPALAGEEYEMSEALLRSYPPFIEALEKRGLDPSKICCDPWCVGFFSSDDLPSRRLAWPALFVRDSTKDNLYGRPLEGFMIRIDIQRREVIHFEDLGTDRYPTPSNNEVCNFDPPPYPYSTRPHPNPIVISQPEGPSFKVHGQEIEWEGWRFRYAFRPREGLVLLKMFIQDPLSKVFRSVAESISFSEMVVPYGDPNYPQYLKNAFDAGNFE